MSSRGIHYAGIASQDPPLLANMRSIIWVWTQAPLRHCHPKPSCSAVNANRFEEQFYWTCTCAGCTSPVAAAFVFFLRMAAEINVTSKPTGNGSMKVIATL